MTTQYQIVPTSQAAQIAVRAAQNVNRWGRYAARRYVERRGVHPSLYRLARQLEALEQLTHYTTYIKNSENRSIER